MHQVAGIRNRTLRPLVATLLGVAYSGAQMSYDLWRLRTNGLLRRLPGTHTWVLTPDGVTAAALYTKTYRRVIDPLFAAVCATAPPGLEPGLRAALRLIDATVDRYAEDARIAA